MTALRARSPLSLAWVLLLAACSWSVPSDPGERAHRMAPAMLEGDVTPRADPGSVPSATLDPGAGRLYAQRCAQCHDLVSPRAHPPGAWPALVDRYGPRAGLFGTDRQRVLRWLQAQAGG